MEQKLVERVSYSYDFKSEELKPLVETAGITQKEDILEFFKSREVLKEGAQAEVSDIGNIMAEVQDDIGNITGSSSSLSQTTVGKEARHTKHYAIMYVNPSTKKAEVLDVASDISIKDYAQEKVEESAAMQSSYPIYSFIGTPLVRSKINPYIMQQIIDNMEYDTPPPFGGASVVKVGKTKKSEIVAVEKEIVKTLIDRKHRVEEEIEKEIEVFEYVVSAIRKGKNPREIISKLPPISRARFKAGLEKGKLTKEMLLMFLERDSKFLKNIKKKLESMKPKELFEMLKQIVKLKDKR
ncbi:hypothetical protein HYT84_03870 [Candidatus Micrarchaeota archaeon]|nr:hypothetical protein [Candidatus Micrarchaeota archaeon]